MCLKKYCECFQANVACSNSCTCLQCCNTVEAHKAGQLPFDNKQGTKQTAAVMDDTADYSNYAAVCDTNEYTMMPPPVTIKSFADYKFYKGNHNSSSNGGDATSPSVVNNSSMIRGNTDLQLSANQAPITSSNTNSSNMKLLANEKWLEVAANDLVCACLFVCLFACLCVLCCSVLLPSLFDNASLSCRLTYCRIMPTQQALVLRQRPRNTLLLLTSVQVSAQLCPPWLASTIQVPVHRKQKFLLLFLLHYP